MRRAFLIAACIVLLVPVYGSNFTLPSDLDELVRDCTTLFENGSGALTPSDSLPDSIRRLHPVSIHIEGHGAVVIVQERSVILERGIYVHLAISPQARTSEDKDYWKV